jgi:hypothetical protein
VYWLFVSEGKEWLMEFKIKNGHINNGDSDDTVTTSTSKRKKSGQQKTLSFLKHWWQLKTIVKARRHQRDISEKWDEAWKLFACNELELKKKIRKGVGKEQSGMCCPHLKMCSALVSRKAILLLDWRLMKIWTSLLPRLLMFRKN